MAQSPTLPTSLNFDLYDEIINGILKPHPWPFNSLHIEDRLYKEVQKEVGSMLNFADIINKKLHNPLIRFTDIPASDYIYGTVAYNKNKTNARIQTFPSPFTVYTATNVKEAYYLFIIEKNYLYNAATASHLLEILTPKELKEQSRKHLQKLKLLAVQTQAYRNYLYSQGYINKLKSQYIPEIDLLALLKNNPKAAAKFSPQILKQEVIPIEKRITLQLASDEFVVKAMQTCLTHSILLFQELFEPYLNTTMLTEQEIKNKFFKDTEHTIQPPKPVFSAITIQPTPPNCKWHKLFKDPKAADTVLQLLREDGMVGTDNSWLETPPLNTMVALYNVLLRKGYMRNPYEKATILAAAFNQQFGADFTYKKWQPKERDSAIIYEDRFGIIPTFKA